jgi:hypothetical protein
MPLRAAAVATRSPDRPDPIGLHRAKVLSVGGDGRLPVDGLEAIDGTPILGIKPGLKILLCRCQQRGGGSDFLPALEPRFFFCSAIFFFSAFDCSVVLFSCAEAVATNSPIHISATPQLCTHGILFDLHLFPFQHQFECLTEHRDRTRRP